MTLQTLRMDTVGKESCPRLPTPPLFCRVGLGKAWHPLYTSPWHPSCWHPWRVPWDSPRFQKEEEEMLLRAAGAPKLSQRLVKRLSACSLVIPMLARASVFRRGNSSLMCWKLEVHQTAPRESLGSLLNFSQDPPCWPPGCVSRDNPRVGRKEWKGCWGQLNPQSLP